jgi:UDP-N-acetyl-D-mannosaminuronate dehydrogenase
MTDLEIQKPFYNAELAAKTNQLKRLDRHAKKVKTQFEKLKLQVQMLMGEQEFVFDEDACVLCTWKHHEKETVDEKKFKKENPLLVAQIEEFEKKIDEYKTPYLYTAVTRRFELKA